ncbi:MAG: hypothetical protein GQ539_13260 [Sulfitobacter sp.]|nr:hypothetical protein [Sulfitobacter sp.]
MTLMQGGLLEKPSSVHNDDTTFDVLEKDAGDEWQVHRADYYTCFTNKNVALLDQGWKIHVSATPQNSAQIADLIYGYCIDNDIHFKILHSPKQLFLFNSKNWPRSASGKFAAIYPPSESRFEEILVELGALLHGLKGPYILSDIRFREGPLFARFGAFKDMVEVDENGVEYRAIYSPEGAPVPDSRLPYFSKPDFVTLPKILEETRQEPSEPNSNGASNRFEIRSAVKFSNAGGLYLANEIETKQIVRLREARPFAGLDADGKDAVHRLENEITILQALASEPSIPQLVSHYQAWEHQFLASEYIKGETLLDELVKRYPFVHPKPDPSELTEYLTWVGDVFSKLEAAINRIHELGVFIGDLHPSNIILTPSRDVFFVDFENSGFLRHEFGECGLGAEGFYVRGCASGAELDQNSLRRTLLMLLCPMVPMLNIDGAKETDLWAAAADLLKPFPEVHSQIPHNIRQHLPKLSEGSDASPAIDWQDFRNQVANGIVSRLKERDDLGEFVEGQHGSQNHDCGLAYGDAGLIYALGLSKTAIPEALLHSTLHGLEHNIGLTNTGVFEGPLGVAIALLHADHEQVALGAFDRIMKTDVPSSLDVFSGLAGHILAFLHAAKKLKSKRLEKYGLDLGQVLLTRLSQDPKASDLAGAGILRGASGLAVALIRLHDLTGRNDYLSMAKTMIEIDIAKGRFLEDGAFHILEGKRNLPYYDQGSAGVGIAINRFNKFEQIELFQEIENGINKSLRIPFVMQSGLFQGQAGFIVAASELERGQSVDECVKSLARYAIDHKGALAFPGVGLSRVSDNLANGAAGILLALSMKLDGGDGDWFV